ncbi:MAG: SprT-like domain-containing protein [Firmicutes bacterium]|nr:SprT-like domain-containing protein [Bacillota bacterium]
MKYSEEDIRKEYDRLDRITGVDTSKIAIRISSRMTRKLGEFRKSGSLLRIKREIAISSRCLDDEDLFYEVIRHEYAHAVVDLRHPLERHVHDEVWKSVCRQIGCRPKATIKLDEKYKANSRPYKYEIVCKKCGASGKYKTMSKAVQYAIGKGFGRLTCRKCGGHSFDVYSLK